MIRMSGHSRRALRSCGWARAFASEPSQQKLSDKYAQLLARGQLKPDDRQRHVVESFLDRLHRRLRGYALPVFEPPTTEEESTDNRKQEDAAPAGSEALPLPKPVMVPRGLYLHGSVGTGKSMLLELLFEHAQVERKRRVHFNKFMLEVHQQLHREKQDQLKRFGRQRHIDLDPSRDAITIVAERMAEDAHLLCFDEFQVTDIADALILRKLFGVFFARGVVVVATSNIRPQKLYENGTNREYFLPFVDQLQRHTKVVDMDSAVDHRQLLQTRAQESFLFPLSTETSARMDELFNELVHEVAAKPQSVERLCVPVMMGRHLEVTGTRDGVCRVDFDHLCNTEKGAADYKALCECFHTVVLESVPVLEMKHHNQARRFILLIDELYEHHTRLVCSSQGPAGQIFRFDEATVQVEEAERNEGATETQKHKQQKDAADQGIPTTSSWDGPVGGYTPAKAAGLQIDNLCAMQDLKIAFHRAVSRLREMQSEKYLHEHNQWRDQRQARLTQVLASHKD